MKTLIRWLLLSIIILFVSTSISYSQQQPVTADSIKAQFLHAWKGYKEYAWGHDDLKPLSKEAHDWYGETMLLTPVDAYDCMLIMGLKDEAAETKKLIFDSLNFNKNIEVQSFEITIRVLGGLISAFFLEDDHQFLELAKDLGNRLLPVFNSKTGMPYRYVNLQTGAIRDSINNPAEIGTALLEFGMLSKVTGDTMYYTKAKNALVSLYNHRSSIGLVGTWINVETGEWTDTSSHIGGCIDSYYEYLLKAWVLFGDKECKAMYDEHINAVNQYVADTSQGGLWYGQVGMNSGKRTGTEYGSLEAFMPAVFAMAGDLERAKQLQESNFKMWQLHDIEPEALNYTTMKVTDKRYILRPEIIESAYYLFQYTGDSTYRKMGETFYHSFENYCKVDAGYTSLDDVITKVQGNRMHSFFFAETLKYLYLLFAPNDALRFNKYIFNTEAHPFRKVWEE